MPAGSRSSGAARSTWASRPSTAARFASTSASQTATWPSQKPGETALGPAEKRREARACQQKQEETGGKTKKVVVVVVFFFFWGGGTLFVNLFLVGSMSLTRGGSRQAKVSTSGHSCLKRQLTDEKLPLREWMGKAPLPSRPKRQALLKQVNEPVGSNKKQEVSSAWVLFMIAGSQSGVRKHWVLGINQWQRHTLPPTNMAPDRGSRQEEMNLPGTSPQAPCPWEEGKLACLLVFPSRLQRFSAPMARGPGNGRGHHLLDLRPNRSPAIPALKGLAGCCFEGNL